MGFTMKERKALFREYAPEYKKATRKRKTIILSELEKTTSLNRRYIAWNLYNHGKKVRTGQRTYVIGDISQKPRKRIKKGIYDKDCQNALEYFWVFADRINSKRLKEALPHWIEKYKLLVTPQAYSDVVLEKLGKMSHGTIVMRILSLLLEAEVIGRMTIVILNKKILQSF